MSNPMQVTIREFQMEDFPLVKEIYQLGIDTKNATFETTAPEWSEWDTKFLKEPRLVANNDQQVMGWAALSQVSQRPVYKGVCEVSVYIHPDFFGKGYGRMLLSELITRSEQLGIWTLQASIFPENTGSIKIHKELGFREVGYRERIGKMGNQWRNTILLERRSKMV